MFDARLFVISGKLTAEISNVETGDAASALPARTGGLLAHHSRSKARQAPGFGFAAGKQLVQKLRLPLDCSDADITAGESALVDESIEALQTGLGKQAEKQG